jgi:hypothetical protein
MKDLRSNFTEYPSFLDLKKKKRMSAMTGGIRIEM